MGTTAKSEVNYSVYSSLNKLYVNVYAFIRMIPYGIGVFASETIEPNKTDQINLKKQLQEGYWFPFSTGSQIDFIEYIIFLRYAS